VATLDGALGDVVRASFSLPTVELETYLLMGSRHRLHVRHVADLVVALILVTQWCWAPVYALAVLKTRRINSIRTNTKDIHLHRL
jgi:hypothetical protein